MSLNSGISPNANNMDIKTVLQTYLKHWIWFLLAAIISIGLALIYLRYTTPQYAAEAKIQIIEEDGAASELSVFKDLDIFSQSGNEVLDEIEMIKSRSNLIEVVKKLKLNITTTAIGNIMSSELYAQPRPFKINFLAADSTINNSKFSFFITYSSETTFGYTEDEDVPVKVLSFGKNFKTPAGDIIITPTSTNVKAYKGKKFQISINPVGEVAQYYQSKIKINQLDKLSNIVTIKLTDPIQNKAIDIINELVKNYNANGVADRKSVADKTSDFINDRITQIASNLSSVDQNAVDFMTNKGISDIGSQTNINLSAGASNQQELEDARYQLMVADAMRQEVDNQNGYQLLPSNIGLADQSITSNTATYNQLVAERKRLLESSNEKNPIIVSLDQQISGLRSTIKSSLSGMTENLSLKLNSLAGQQSRINSSLYSAPKNQQALRDITRKQQTTESLYLYLLQKREESQIAYASAAAKSKVIDAAYASSRFPVSPKRNVVLLASLIMGLIIPFSIIYAKDLLDNKVHNKIGLEKIAKNIPVLAEIPHLGKKESKLILDNDRSILAESLRILRTNLDYVIKSKKSKGKNNIIYVTSSVSGEGKTFLASNLAMIFSNTGKKTLLIGADIRNPKLYTFFNNNSVDQKGNAVRGNSIGLTEFLYDSATELNEITEKIVSGSNAIDIIYSGKIPPNPSELLMSDRMKTLLDEASEKYDYVIVDTAPLLVVTDTVLISEYASQIVYVVRAGVTEQKVIDYPLNLVKEGKLKELSFVVNDVKNTDLGYGGKYGYGYSAEVKKWWKFWA
ncbi:GumC family protein [Cellulophaga tyrosinoxydans]|uniref:non-specific protein-tyrosine kinase n=1 Tax=Cellulophaga tyrosinoxydans TaxID=504486 RepID=A0A1W2A2E2_9FLAO|nr:polysaccharide biosynthesis tyrosine autokinase [Cellulophaga tyrosinoxydans]SMC54601.1 capsular exopolysaccharide family [Cellulophaga tyrosinoxydans]